MNDEERQPNVEELRIGLERLSGRSHAIIATMVQVFERGTEAEKAELEAAAKRRPGDSDEALRERVEGWAAKHLGIHP